MHNLKYWDSKRMSMDILLCYANFRVMPSIIEAHCHIEIKIDGKIFYEEKDINN